MMETRAENPYAIGITEKARNEMVFEQAVRKKWRMSVAEFGELFVWELVELINESVRQDEILKNAQGGK